MLRSFVRVTPPPSARLALAGAFAWAAACAPATALERGQVLMGTVFTARVWAADSAASERELAAALDEVARLERVMSSWSTTSELARVNDALDTEPVPLSDDLGAVLDSALAMAALTGGAFDPTIAPLLDAWDVRGRGRSPSRGEIERARARVGHPLLRFDRGARALEATRAGVRLDLGGIGKGFALDRAAARLADAAEVRLDFGGQWLVRADTVVTIAVAHPSDRLRPAAWVHLARGSVATSAQSESPARVRGRSVHVLDPRTGVPATSRAAVTVVGASATRADALSTALLVMGREAAAEFAARHAEVGVLWLEPAGRRVRAWRWNLPTATFADGVDVEAERAPGTRWPPEEGIRLPMRFARTLLLTAVLAAPAHAAPSDSARVADLERRVEALTADLEALRLGAAGVRAERTESKSAFGFAPGASRVYGAAPGVSIGGYGEALYQNFAAKRGDGAPANLVDRADLLRVVLYVGHKFSDELLLNTEIEWEHAGIRDEAVVEVDPLSGEGAAELSGEVVVEFAYLDWSRSRAFGVRAGQLLVPLGLVNEQHEPPVFPGARRPDVERRIIPSTWSALGAGVFGELSNGIAYRAYLMEGLDAEGFSASGGVRGGRQFGSQARLQHPAIAARLDWSSPAGVTVGGAVHTGRVWQRPADPISPRSRFTLAEAHAKVEWKGLVARALVAQGSLSDAAALSAARGVDGTSSAIGERSFGATVDAQYDVMPHLAPGSRFVLQPYVRWESSDTQDGVDAPGSDAPANRWTSVVAGAQLRPHPNVVLKADHEWRRNDADTQTNQLNVALGYLF